MRSKSQRHCPYGLLKQLLIPERPWNSISMDFIKKLPMSNGSNMILVIVDHLTKRSIFILTINTIMSPMLAKLFVLHVFFKHGIPSHVTSNQGSEFVSAFFCSLGKVLDMKLHFTSSYHPKGDGQTECANQTLEQYLQVYCNYQQNNWSNLLLLVEFAYNNAPNTTMGLTPFYANKGYHPSITVHPKHDIASTGPETLWLTSTTCTNNSDPTYLMCRKDTQSPQTNVRLCRWTSRSEIKSFF